MNFLNLKILEIKGLNEKGLESILCYSKLLKLKKLYLDICKKKIYNHAVEEQKWVEEGKIKLIGVNLYPKLEKNKSIEELYSENVIKPVRLAEMYE